MRREARNMLTSKTKIYGLLGYPIKHSFSPLIHNAAFEAEKIDACYLCFETKPEDIKQAIEGIRALNIQGVNLTIPHKEICLSYLDEIDKNAEFIGAVNTIVRKENKLIGYNTDGEGFIKALKEDLDFDSKDKTIFLFGAGGAGKAIGMSLAKYGAKQIFIVDKNKKKARALAENIKENFPNTIAELTHSHNQEAIKASHLLVNATPIGMNPNDNLMINPVYFPQQLNIFDLIYNPRETKLLRIAKKKGLKAVNGLGMLIHQATLSFELWTGEKAPLAVMKEAVEKK